MSRRYRIRVRRWLVEHHWLCSTCGRRFSSPHCSLNRDPSWSGHTIHGGVGQAEPRANGRSGAT